MKRLGRGGRGVGGGVGAELVATRLFDQFVMIMRKKKKKEKEKEIRKKIVNPTWRNEDVIVRCLITRPG